MRVYYFTAQEFALSNIVNKRIKISRINDLNDPYEFMMVNQSDVAFRKSIESGKTLATEISGVICFSRSWGNPLMWGHYGNKHKGICLGFDIPDEFIEEVEYVPVLLAPDFDMEREYGGLNEAFFKRLLTLKFEGWKYEDEVRVLVPLNEMHPSGYYFTDFGEEINLKEIILGPRCVVTIDDVKKHLHGYTEQVTIIKSKIAYEKYEVVCDDKSEIYVHKQC